MCILREFCCGCTLRHGAITAAVLNAIAAIVMIAVGAQLLRLAQMADDGFQPYTQDKEATDAAVNFLRITGGVNLGLGLISLVIFICLVVGIVKNIAGLVMPWLIGCMIYIVLLCIYILVLVIFGVFVSLVGLLGIAFYIYLWIVVLNYYRELQEGPPAYTPETKA